MMPESNKPESGLALQGLRRTLTREQFEELCALQCRPEEILGYAGTEMKPLRTWCRKVYGRKYTLEQIMHMLRQDGLISIRRASFEMLKKSAPLVAQQYNRFLPGTGQEEGEDNAAIKAFTAMLGAVSEEKIGALFDPPKAPNGAIAGAQLDANDIDDGEESEEGFE